MEADGANALALGPEALMPHLCAHLALHRHGEGLLWLHDVAEVLHAYRDRLDWGQVVECASATALRVPCRSLILSESSVRTSA